MTVDVTVVFAVDVSVDVAEAVADVVAVDVRLEVTDDDADVVAVVVCELVAVLVRELVPVDDCDVVTVEVSDDVAVEVCEVVAVDVSDVVAVEDNVDVAVVVSSSLVVHKARSRNCRANASQYASSFSAAANGIERPPFFRNEHSWPCSQLHLVSRRDERSTVVGAFAKSKTKRSMSGTVVPTFSPRITSRRGHFGYGPGPSELPAVHTSPRSHTLSLRHWMAKSLYSAAQVMLPWPADFVSSFMHFVKAVASLATARSVSSSAREHPHIDWQHAQTFSPAVASALTPFTSASVSPTTNLVHDRLALSTNGVPLFPRFCLHFLFSLSSNPSQSSVIHHAPHQSGASSSEQATASAKHDFPIL